MPAGLARVLGDLKLVYRARLVVAAGRFVESQGVLRPGGRVDFKATVASGRIYCGSEINPSRCVGSNPAKELHQEFRLSTAGGLFGMVRCNLRSMKVPRLSLVAPQNSTASQNN
jgi:hypothetical protein